jgi:nucleoside-diphosphate-sugar epimerase
MRIFVTGATGVAGRRAVPLLVAAGHEVTGVARTPERAAAVEKAGARAVQLSLFDADAVRRAVAGHDAVLNLATAVPSSSRMMLPGAWREMDRIRRDASRVLVDAALAGGVSRFVQESFAPIYADQGDAWIDESSPMKPARYNRAVLDAEASAERFTRGGGTGVVLRFGFFYGPDAGGATLDMIPFVRKGWSPAAGAEGFISSIAHDDVATAAVAALGIPAGIYNVVDDEPLRHRDFFSSMAAALGAPSPKFLPKWAGRLMGGPGETLARSLRISNRKFREASGWAPKYPSVRDAWPDLLREAGIAAATGGR